MARCPDPRAFIATYHAAVRKQGTLTIHDSMAEWPNSCGFPKHFRMPAPRYWPGGVWPAWLNVARPVKARPKI